MNIFDNDKNKEDLLKALDNDENINILNTTFSDLNKIKLNVLEELNFEKKEITTMLLKLKHYRYIDEIDNIKISKYIRWILLTNLDDIHLNKGGVVLDVKMIDKKIAIVVKSFSGKIFNIKMDENLIFQKLTNQELVILSAMEYLTTTN
jgi:hypothetical protein